MEKELSKAAASALNDLVANLSQAKNFALEQLPDVLHQILTYHLISGILNMIVCVFIIYISYLAVFHWTNQKLVYGGDWAASKLLAASVGGFTSFGAACVFIVSLETVVKIVVAPKLYLIEYALALTK